MRLSILALSLLLGACATVGSIDEPPKVSLVGIQPEQFQLFEQRYRVTIRVQNPNDAPLTVRGMSYEIQLNDRPFGTGVDGEGFTVPAYGEETVSVLVTSNLARVYEQFREFTSSKEIRIRYGITGSLSVEGALGKVPFDYEGELDLGAMKAPPRGKII